MENLEYETLKIKFGALLGQANDLADVLDELMDLMEGVKANCYKPDSFTNQPAAVALNKWLAFKKELGLD